MLENFTNVFIGVVNWNDGDVEITGIHVDQRSAAERAIRWINLDYINAEGGA